MFWKNGSGGGVREDASMEELWEGVLWRMTVHAVPTLLSCLAFTSFSPLFFVSSIPFSLLFVTLSVVISVASWCWSPIEGAAADTKCCTWSSKLGTRSWWCCGEAPRGFQLAMLVLTWALLFLLLCMPPMANAQIGKLDHAVTERLPDLDDDGQELVALVLKDLGVDTGGSESGGSEKRPDEEPQSSSDDSADSSHQSTTDAKVGLPSCRALVRLGQQVTCAAPALSPAPEYVSTEFRDCSSGDTLCVQPVFPALLEFGQQPLHQRQVAFLTIMNSCNGSRLSLLVARSDNRQFLVGGFAAKLLAPGGTVKFPVFYLPEHLGRAKGSIVVETTSEPLVVQVQGEGVPSLYKLQVRVQANSHSVISLFNPFGETLFVEEAVVVEEPPSSVLGHEEEEEVVIEAQEECGDDHGLMMRAAGETWALPGQSTRDILDFNVCLNQGEVFRGSFHIRVTGDSLEEDQGITLVYRFSSRVSRPSPVLSVPHTLDFGMLVGDQASSQPLVLHNSGHQLVQIEDIYELSGDSKISIDYEKGQILGPNSETEVANVTYSGQNQSVPCMKPQKIMVRTNSTIAPLIEIPYRAMVLQCLHAPPPMAFGTGSPGGAAGDLGGSQELGITDLLMNGKVLFMGLLICVVLAGAVFCFHAVVRDAKLPTFSSECHGRSISPLMKMWGWGALATVVDGVWTACGSSLWTNKECTTPAPDYTLPRFVTAPSSSSSSPASPSAATTASKKGARKGSKAAKSKGHGETGLPVTSTHHHHPPSVKQPKPSKFLRPENPAKHLVHVPVDDVVIAPVVQEEEPSSLASDPKPDSPIQEPPKKTGAPPEDRQTPVATQELKKKRRKRSNKGSHLGTISPASPSSPVAPSWSSTPSSPGKKSDQSSSPRSVDLADAAPLPQLKVRIATQRAKMDQQPPRKQPPFEKPKVPKKNEPAPLARKKTPPASTGFFQRGLFTEPSDFDGSQWLRRPQFAAASLAPPPPPPPPPPAPAPAPAPPAPIAPPKRHPTWSSLGITPSPEEEETGDPTYNIWGNQFGDLSSVSEPLQHPPLQQGDMSPTAAALYATRFPGFFSDSRPASPDHLSAAPRPRPGPYSPPMGNSGFSPLGNNTTHRSIWAHDSSSSSSSSSSNSSSNSSNRRRVPEKVVPPSLPPSSK